MIGKNSIGKFFSYPLHFQPCLISHSFISSYQQIEKIPGSAMILTDGTQGIALHSICQNHCGLVLRTNGEFFRLF